MTDGRQGAAIDHVVVNTLYDMDDAARCLASIGFCLTPRGYHTLGSINHLVVLDDSYVELVGLPRDGDRIRKELLEHPKGINGLVFAESAADERYAYLSRAGFRVDPPQVFSRPVDCSEGVREARFTAVRLAGDTFPAGRVYFCHHHTPELVWRDEWQSHDNTAYSLAGVSVVGADPVADAASYGNCINRVPDNDQAGPYLRLPANRGLGGGHGTEIRFITEEAYRRRYGDLCCERLERTSYFGAIRIRVHSMSALLAVMGSADPGISHVQLSDGAVAVSIPSFNCLMEFVEEGHHASPV